MFCIQNCNAYVSYVSLICINDHGYSEISDISKFCGVHRKILNKPLQNVMVINEFGFNKFTELHHLS